jgi:hypothetical protein
MLARHSLRLRITPNVFDTDWLLLQRAEQAHLTRGYQLRIAILEFDSQERNIAVVVDWSRDPNPPTRQGVFADFMHEALLHHEELLADFIDENKTRTSVSHTTSSLSHKATKPG